MIDLDWHILNNHQYKITLLILKHLPSKRNVVIIFTLTLMLSVFPFFLDVEAGSGTLFSGLTKQVSSDAYVNRNIGFTITPPSGWDRDLSPTDLEGDSVTTAFYAGVPGKSDGFILDHFILDTRDIQDMIQSSESDIEEAFEELTVSEMNAVSFSVSADAETFSDALKIKIKYSDRQGGTLNQHVKYLFFFDTGDVFNIDAILSTDSNRAKFDKTMDSFYVGPVRVTEQTPPSSTQNDTNRNADLTPALGAAVFWIIVVIIIVTVVIKIRKKSKNKKSNIEIPTTQQPIKNTNNELIEILKKQFVNGEITAEEYKEKKKILEE